MLSPGWVSLRVLVWLAGVASAAAAAMMWLNLQELHVSLDPSAARRMAEGAAAVSVASVVFFVMAVVRFSVGRRPGWITAGVFAGTVALSFALPLWLRGHGTVVRSGAAHRRGSVIRGGLVGWTRHRARRRWRHRSTTSRRPRRMGACRTSAGCSTTVRSCTSRRCVRRSRCRSGPPWPRPSCRTRTACGRPRATSSPATEPSSTCCPITASRTHWSISGWCRSVP